MGYGPWIRQELYMTEHAHAHTHTHTRDIAGLFVIKAESPAVGLLSCRIWTHLCWLTLITDHPSSPVAEAGLKLLPQQRPQWPCLMGAHGSIYYCIRLRAGVTSCWICYVPLTDFHFPDGQDSSRCASSIDASRESRIGPWDTLPVQNPIGTVSLVLLYLSYPLAGI